jgi:hypothetical protein
VKLPTCILAAAALATCALAAPAATAPRDLGLGLSYYRVHELPRDFPFSAKGQAGPCVLDLRFATADGPSCAALTAWIRFNSSARAPVFVLENSSTSPSLVAALPMGSPGLVVIAPRTPKMGADVAVAVSAESDKKAYDAAEKGATLDSLIHDYPEKPRLDEAYLEKEHLSDSDALDDIADRPGPPMPLVDAVLQKAVQLHRGLLALKRV